MTRIVDALRGELERHLELDDMVRLSDDYLGFQSSELGGNEGKAAFARSLVDQCQRQDSLEALADALVLTGKVSQEAVDKALATGHDDELKAGFTLDAFRILKLVGKGALGDVYLAETEVDGVRSRVAIKIIARQNARDRSAVSRYLTAQRALKQANIPGLASIAGVGVLEDGRPWVATEFVTGQALSARVGRIGPMHFNEAKPLVESVLVALAELHKRGLVHGDIKTENVFIVRAEGADGSRGEPSGILVDGGADRLLARTVNGNSSSPGFAVFSTPKSFDPNLANGTSADQTSDLYAVGAMLYEVLTGRPPFIGDNGMDVIAQHLTQEAPAPSTIAPRGWISEEIDKVALKALAKDPADRFPTAVAFAEALGSAVRAATQKKKETKPLDEKAFKAASKALKDDATEANAAKLEEVVAPSGQWDKLVEALTAAIEKAKGDEAKKAMLFRLARVQDSEVDNEEAAEAAYRQVLEMDEDDDMAMIGLEELKRARSNYEELAEILVEKVGRSEDSEERAGMLREIGRIYEEHLGSKENALVAFTQALADDPTDEDTIKEVERLATTPEEWGETVASLAEVAQESQHAAHSVPLYVLMGRWYGEKLQRPDYAVQCFGQALQGDPNNEAAYAGTIELYKRSQSWQELVTLLLARAETAPTPSAARDYQAEAASVIYSKLSDTDRAAGIFQSIVDDDPAHPAATDALASIYEGKSDWQNLAKVLKSRSKNESGEARVTTEVRMGELFEDRLSDIGAAKAHFQNALDVDGDNTEALKGLERVFARGGEHKELMSVLEKQLELAPTPRQKITLLERIAGIHEEEFVDHKAAIGSLEQVVQIEAGHETANVSLARLYRHTKQFEQLAETLDRHAKTTEDKARKAEILLHLVKVQMKDLGKPEAAAAVCEHVLTVSPDNADALELMAVLKAESGDSAAATAAMERLAQKESDPKKQAALWFRAGKLLDDQGDADGAADRYKKALDADPKSTDAAAALRKTYAAKGDAHGASELLLKEIDATDGDISKARLYADLGDLYRDRLDELEKAQGAFEQALELDANCTAASRGLSEMAFATEDYTSAARHSEPLLSRTSDMPKDMAREVSLLSGDAFRQLGDFKKAQRAYLNAKAFAPNDRVVAERVADLTFESGEADEAAELYREILKKFGPKLQPAERGRVLYRLGESCRKAGNFDEAIPFLSESSQLSEDSGPSLDALTAVYEAKESWELVLRTLGKRMDSASDEERFNMLVKSGDIHMDKLGKRDKAQKDYVAALEIKADDRNLLTKLMGVYSESKEWARLVEVILRIADLVDDSRQLAKYYNTAAAISHRELKRLDEAADYYEQTLEHDPGMASAFDGLVDCLGGKREYTRLADAYRSQLKRLGDGAPKDKRAALWDSLGDVLASQLSDTRQAVEAYQEAQVLDPENRPRAEKLASIYSDDPQAYFSKAVDIHGRLLKMNPFRTESYQALRKLYTDMKRPDESWCVCQALTVLKLAEDEEKSFFKKHRTKKAAAAQEFFSEDVWFNNIIHNDQDPLLTGIFARITPAVVASRAQALADFGIAPGDQRDAAQDPAAMAQTLNYAAGVSKIALPPVFYRESDPGGLSFVFTNPPAIGLGKGALAGGPAQALAFVAGRHLAYFHNGHYLRHLVPTGSGLRAWLLAAIKIAQPQFPVPGELSGPVNEHLAALNAHLSAPDRDEVNSLVQKLLNASPSLDMKKWVAAVDLTVDRVGFILANDLEISAAVIRATPEGAAGISQKDRLSQLQLYSVSREYLQLRHKLGIAIGE